MEVVQNHVQVYLSPDQCGGATETFLDVFVIVKAIAITYFSA